MWYLHAEIPTWELIMGVWLWYAVPIVFHKEAKQANALSKTSKWM